MNTTHPLARCSVALVVGRRGSGKSVLLRRAQRTRPRVVVLDAMHGETFDTIAPVGGGAWESCTVTNEEDYLDALRWLASESRWRLIVRPDDPAQAWWVFAGLMPANGTVAGYARAVGGVAVWCDEFDLVAPNNAGIHPAVRASAQRGRHYQLHLLAATRRPAEVHRDVSSQADVLATFRQHEPNDVKFLKDVSPDLAGIARGLGRWQYCTYEADTAALRCYDGRDRAIPNPTAEAV